MATINAQVDQASRIQNFVTNTKKTKKADRTLSFLQVRQQLLNGYWEKFQTNHALLVSAEESFEDDYFKKDSFSVIEEAYCNAQTFLQNEMAGLRPVAGDTTLNLDTSMMAAHVGPNHVRVKPLPVPEFDGTHVGWEAFKELFESMIIKNPEIPAIQKLQHLKNNVKGRAALLLKGIQIIEGNFEVAWDKLRRRYDDSELIVRNHLDKLMDVPQCTQRSAEGLAKILDVADETRRYLKEMEYPVDQYDLWFKYHITRKLDKDTLDDWNIDFDTKEDKPTYSELYKFIEQRIKTLERSNSCLAREKGKSSDGKQHQNKSSFVTETSDASSGKFSDGKKSGCPCCKKQHLLYQCFKFKKLNVSQRWDLVRSSREVCFKCLGSGHRSSGCRSKIHCGKCDKIHHPLLHKDEAQSTRVNDAQSRSRKNSTASSEKDAVVATHVGVPENRSTRIVLLATARVGLKVNGRIRWLRALIDQGSESSFLKKSVSQALGLKTVPLDLNIIGIGGEVSTSSREAVDVVLTSHYDKKFELRTRVIILPKLTACLPSTSFEGKNYRQLRGIKLADPEYNASRGVDMILGAAAFASILEKGTKKMENGELVAQQTKLGWILTGSAGRLSQASQEIRNCNVGQMESDSSSGPGTSQGDDKPVQASSGRLEEPGEKASPEFMENMLISELIRKFWEIEGIPNFENSQLTSEEQQCEDHFRATYYREADGRYGVRLPFLDTPDFPGARTIALKQWSHMKNRLEQKSELKAAYQKFMRDYLEMGHMERVPETEINNPSCYIPHHAVVKKGNVEKIRVVFNASCKMGGKTLNDLLLVGPKLQTDVRAVLSRWRFKKIVFSCDMVKMFRQIRLHPDDRDWCRILFNFGEKVEDFRLCTVTYGTSCAPFQALRVIKQLIEDTCRDKPDVRDVLLNQRFVDDIYGGADTLEEARKLAEQVREVLSQAQIPLDKWASNVRQLLPHVDSWTEGKEIQIHDFVSTLGMMWCPEKDEFTFSVETKDANELNKVTKRQVLSESMKLYDPLGWIAPILVKNKLFIQELWIQGVDWDEELSKERLFTWKTLKRQLQDLNAIKIPRWLGILSDSSWRLHGFCDASKRAYAAVIYAVTDTSSQIIIAKTRAAPIKTQSIPRLELMGAQMLAQLISWILPLLPSQPESITCWCDAKDVLFWIHTLPIKLKIFEANRVSDIHSKLPQAVWKYVPTIFNPADCATKGISVETLKSFNLWWNGPEWLMSSQDWPKETDFQPYAGRQELQSFHESMQVFEPAEWLGSFACWQRLIRVMAYVRRFLLVLDPSPNVGTSWLNALELNRAAIQVLRVHQQLHFSREIEELSMGQEIYKASSILSLQPILGEDLLLRVGGRLRNAHWMTYEERHPVIIARNSHLGKLLIQDAHGVTMHGGVQLTASYLRQKYWIIGGKRQMSEIFRRCPRCIRMRGQVMSQQMADLPEVRVNPALPFVYTGVDYAGPFSISASRGRGIKSNKGYVAIFVCLVTKAVHLEVVSSLESVIFLDALDRFMSRRGVCTKIYSDNGTNFQGAWNEMKQFLLKNQESIIEKAANQNISWSFIPPKAPHFGGIWEAAVKSFKYHLRRVVGDTVLSYEEFSTLCCKIEACLNSRPLCAMDSDSENFVLTPAHFLIGRILLSRPDPNIEFDLSQSHTNRYILLSAMRNDFFKHWQKDVVSQMQQRNKWVVKKDNLSLGDIVLIKDELTKPGQWPLGKIVKLYTSGDDLVRVVDVQTASTVLKRPTVKLILIPTDAPVQQVFVSLLARQD